MSHDPATTSPKHDASRPNRSPWSVPVGRRVRQTIGWVGVVISPSSYTPSCDGHPG